MALGDLTASLSEAPVSAYSDENIRRKRLLAEQLMQQGSDTSSIRSPWQGVARLAQGLMGGLNAHQADTAEHEKQQYNSDLMRGLLTPQNAVSAAPAAPSSAPASFTPKALPNAPEGLRNTVVSAAGRYGIPENVALAMASQESSMNPNAPHGGLLQITQGTAANPGYGMKPVQYASLTDPATNADFGFHYLAAKSPNTDWNNPAQVDKALAAYNGGGDPNYVEHVRRFMPQEASLGGAAAPQSSPSQSAAAPAQSGQAQKILLAMADPRLSPQNKQILALMYQNATKETTPTEMERDLAAVHRNPELQTAFNHKYGGDNKPFVMGEQPDGMGGFRKIYGTMQDGKPVPLQQPEASAPVAGAAAPQIPAGVSPKKYAEEKAKQTVKDETAKAAEEATNKELAGKYDAAIAAYQDAINNGAIGQMSGSDISRTIGGVVHSKSESSRRAYEQLINELKLIKTKQLMKGQGQVSNAERERIDRLFPTLTEADPNRALGILKSQRDELLGVKPQADETATTPGVAPYPGARQAKDGHWYVQQDGKYFRVDD